MYLNQFRKLDSNIKASMFPIDAGFPDGHVAQPHKPVEIESWATTFPGTSVSGSMGTEMFARVARG